MIESDVNQRPISTFKLKNSIEFKNWKIDLVELPAPKKTKNTPLGFEHMEVVCDLSFLDLEKKYEHLRLDLGGLAKDFNQEFEILLGPRNLKFHHLSLSSVINMEKNKKVWNAIANSKILRDFKQNTPLVAGTFPLGIQTQASDVDVLLEANDLNAMDRKLRERFGQCLEFRVSREMIEGLESLIVNFIFDDVPFEVFVQNKETVRQTAYLHFLIEERLLKLGGEHLRQNILRTRALGLKTESAFAQVLKLEGDPHQAMLELQRSPTFKLNY